MIRLLTHPPTSTPIHNRRLKSSSPSTTSSPTSLTESKKPHPLTKPNESPGKNPYFEIIDLNIPLLFGTREEQKRKIAARYLPKHRTDSDAMVKEIVTDERLINGEFVKVEKEIVKYKDPQFMPKV